MIRQAEIKDISRITELYIAGLEEVGVTDIKPHLCERKVIDSFLKAPCFLLVNDDIIHGIAGLTLNTASWSGVATLCDYMFYVSPDHRNLKSLGGLVSKCKEFADSHDMTLRLEFISKNDEKLKERLLKMHGFKVGGVIGVYNE